MPRVSGVCGFGCARVLSWGQLLSSALDRDWRFGSAVVLFWPSVLLSPAASWAEEVPAVGAAFPSCFLGGGGSSVHLFPQPPGSMGDMSTIQRPPDVVTKGDLHWF
ncbi:hypothetical protein ACQJBY_054376 [Aegilops geniculata]